MIIDELSDAPKYQRWRADLEANGIDVSDVAELETVRKPNGEVLFSMLRMEATSPEGNPLLPIVVVRGHFVSVLTCLIDKQSGERKLLLVKQRRVANGAEFYEHPAGMMDSYADPKKVAQLELREETGVEVPLQQIHRMNEDLYYSSPGLIDEGGYFFWTELELTGDEIAALHDRATGADNENEFIRTHVATFAEARQLIKNSNGLLHLFLYEEAKRTSPP